MFWNKGLAVAVAVFTGMVITPFRNGLAVLSGSQGSQQISQTPQSTGTDWRPTWNTAPDNSRKAKSNLVPTVALADDGFHGSPIFKDPQQKMRNAQAREAIVRSLPSIPECSGVTWSVRNTEDTDFVLQIFNGIDGRIDRLQWILYRTDTLGESAHGEGTGASTRMGQDGVMRDVCSIIRNLATPENRKIEEHQPLTESIEPSIEAWNNSAKSLETFFSHLRYSLPRGFSALPEDIRIDENRKRYETQRAQSLKQEGRNTEAHNAVDGQEVTVSRKTEILTPYVLLTAAPTAPTTIETNQLPRVDIYAHKRVAMLMEASDPARLLMYLPQVSVLRGPEDVMLSGHKFVRTDFHFHSGDYLSKFSTVDGDYLLEFDFRSTNEKDLRDMVNSMQSVVFQQ